MKTTILKRTDKELLILKDTGNTYRIEHEVDREGNEEVVVTIEGNARHHMLEKILKNVFEVNKDGA